MSERIECFMVERADEAVDNQGVSWFVPRRADTGEVLGGLTAGLYRVPPGAMLIVKHHANSHHRPADVRGGELDHLVVMTPAGAVCVDCPATGEGGVPWQRTGEPPKVTVTPSLNIGPEAWHGWLTDGFLVR